LYAHPSERHSVVISLQWRSAISVAQLIVRILHGRSF
jgi:hypothetical protein